VCFYTLKCYTYKHIHALSCCAAVLILESVLVSATSFQGRALIELSKRSKCNPAGRVALWLQRQDLYQRE
jgi:hypothetical protein